MRDRTDLGLTTLTDCADAAEEACHDLGGVIAVLALQAAELDADAQKDGWKRSAAGEVLYLAHNSLDWVSERIEELSKTLYKRAELEKAGASASREQKVR